MKESIHIFLIGLCLFAIVTCSCVFSRIKPPLRLVDQSHKRVPEWVHKLYKEENGTIYVVGEKTNASSQEEGETDARMQAARKLIEVNFGLKGYSYYQRLKTLLETEYQDNLKMKTEGEIWGVKEIDIVWKKYELIAADGVKYRWDIWVRLAVNKEELEKAVEKALAKEELVFAQARKYSEDAEALIDKGEIAPGLLKLGIARSHLQEIGEDPESFALLLNINAMIQETLSKLRLYPSRKEVEACRVGEGLEQPLQIGVSYDGNPVEYFPVVFGFIEGEGVVDELVYTDSAGIANAHVTRLRSPGNPNLVEAGVAFGVLNLEQFPSQKVRLSFGSLPPLELPLRGRRRIVGLPTDKEAVEEIPSLVKSSHDLYPRITEKSLEFSALLSPVSLPGKRFEEFVVMIEIRAPGASNVERPAMSIAAVLDKSGSMGKENKLEFTKEALYFLFDNLTPQDYLSIVAYDSQARVLRPSKRVRDRWFSKHLIEKVSSGQTTNLSGGLLAGYAQIKSTFQDDTANRVILLSDGLANTGITDPDRIYQFVENELTRGISTTTIGVGSSFDTDLMMGISEYGGGKYYFVENPEDIPQIFEKELKSLLTVTAQNISLRVESGPGVEIQRVYGNHDLEDPGAINLSLGDMSSKEHRIIMFKLTLENPRVQSREGMSLVTLKLNYNDVRKTGDRVTEIDTLAIPVDPGKGGKSIKGNPRVDHFYKLAEAFSNLLEYHRSHSKDSYRRSSEFYNKEYSRIQDYVRTEEEICLEVILESYRECFEMCRIQRDLRGKSHHGITSKDSLRRETEYYNYLLFYHIDW